MASYNYYYIRTHVYHRPYICQNKFVKVYFDKVYFVRI